MAVAPVFLTESERIKGLLCLEFLALLIRALIEREIRQAMAREHLAELSLYPEDWSCSAPTATRMLAILEDLAQHRLFHADTLVQIFPAELSPLQQQVLAPLDVPTVRLCCPLNAEDRSVLQRRKKSPIKCAEKEW